MKLLKFLSTAGFIFCLFFVVTANSASAEDCAWDPEKSWQGVCSMYCTEGEEIENTTGTADDCADNSLYDICCVPDPNANDGDICFGENGEEGLCQADCDSWMPGGTDYVDVGGTDCEGNTFQTSCCSEEGGNNDDPENPGNPGNPDPITPVTADTLIPEVGLPDPGEDGIQTILVAFLNWLLIIFLIASLIAFVLTGLMYLLAMGNSRSDLMDRAKKYFVDAIIALAITGSGLIIINVVNEFLNGEL